MALDLPASVVAELAALDEVSFIDNDNDTQVLGHVTTTTGAEQVRTQSGTSAKLDGTGIGIAILDSGLYNGHKAFNDYSKKSRIVYSQDFTGEKRGYRQPQLPRFLHRPVCALPGRADRSGTKSGPEFQGSCSRL